MDNNNSRQDEAQQQSRLYITVVDLDEFGKYSLEVSAIDRFMTSGVCFLWSAQMLKEAQWSVCINITRKEGCTAFLQAYLEKQTPAQLMFDMEMSSVIKTIHLGKHLGDFCTDMRPIRVILHVNHSHKFPDGVYPTDEKTATLHCNLQLRDPYTGAQQYYNVYFPMYAVTADDNTTTTTLHPQIYHPVPSLSRTFADAVVSSRKKNMDEPKKTPPITR